MSRKILIVDDEKDMVETLEKRLTASGYTVITAGNGEEGLKAVEMHNPDLLVVDINMPIMDGYTMIKELKRNIVYKNIPIMVATGRERLKELLALEGICDYLIKPFEADELLARIEWNIKTGIADANKKQNMQEIKPVIQKTILIVDDDLDLIETLKIRLEAVTYIVRTANNGEEAITAVNENAPDCIVMDVMMPKMDGFSTLKQLNQVLQKKIPIIIMTGTKSIPEEEFRIEGARGFLRKPFDAQDLIKLLVDVIA